MTSDDDGIAPDRESRAFAGECLSKQPFDPIAIHRAADLARHRQAKPSWLLGSTRKHVQHELATRV